MKKLITSLICMLVAMCAYPQKDVTQFLGIPIDGSKSTMIQKLKAKGFRANPFDDDVLEGTFNGTDVHLHIVTNGDKVCRIMLSDANHVDERSIQIRFNNLCRQFENNPKYMSLGNILIPDDEDISYEMSVKKKRYEAVFYQHPAGLTDSTLLQEKIIPQLLGKYTPEELANPTEDIQKEVMNIMMELYSKKPVWFMINNQLGKFHIIMFYDNEYNRANGEDL